MSDSPWTPAYHIVEWDERYEVSDKDRAWKKGNPKRLGPLAYVRLKVHGHSWGRGWRAMLKLCGDRSTEVWGVYVKAIEIAADCPSEHRGLLPNSRIFAEITGFPGNSVEYAFQCFVTLKWIKPYTNNQPTLPGESGISHSYTESESYTYTESESEKHTLNPPNSIKEIIHYCTTSLGWSISEQQAKGMSDYYAPPGGDGIWRRKIVGADGVERLIELADWRRGAVAFKAHQRKDKDKGGDPTPVARPLPMCDCGRGPVVSQGTPLCEQCVKDYR